MSADPAEIRPGLYLGSKISAENLNTLQTHNICSIINTSEEIPCYHKEAGIDYKSLHLKDDEEDDIGAHFTPCTEYIKSCLANGNAVLVHCQAGISRSATIIIAYLMMEEKMTLKEAFFDVKGRKANIQPNEYFFKALQRAEIELRGEEKGGERGEAEEGTPSFSIEEYYLDVLCGMGFARERAQRALKDAQNDFNLAVSLCL